MEWVREGASLRRDTIDELAKSIGKSPTVINEWFKELVKIFNHKGQGRTRKWIMDEVEVPAYMITNLER